MLATKKARFIAALVVCLEIAWMPAIAGDEDARARVVTKIESEGRFEFVHSRAERPQTPPVPFIDFIVWGIETQRDIGEDEERESEVKPVPDDFSCAPAIISAMSRQLDEKGFEVTSPPDDNAAYVFELEILGCGFRVVNRTTLELAPYVAARYRIAVPGRATSAGKSSLMVTEDARKIWDDLLADPAGAKADFEAVRIKACMRLADRLIYAIE